MLPLCKVTEWSRIEEHDNGLSPLGAIKDTLVSIRFFFKGAQAGGRNWDLLVFVYFLSQKQRLRPLGYCAPHLVKVFLISSTT